MTRRRILGLAAVTAVLCAALAGSAGSARAAYPGANGRLAFGMTAADGRNDIFTARPNGTGLRRLTFDPFSVCAAYSADGRRIAFCRLGPTGDAEIWTMTSGGGGKHSVSPKGGFLLFPDFSPDGSKIAASGVVDPTATKDQIWVMNSRNGSHVHALTTPAEGNCDYPAWSPNGRRIVFISDRTGIEQVWVMNADGSHQHELTFALVTHDEVPDWSPNGKKIAFGVGDPGSGTIWVMNANGSDQHEISSGPGDEFGPTWSPNGKKIAFVTDLGTSRPIEVMNPDGSDLRVVTPGRHAFVPAWQPIP
jgi:Tol biopolymer transport system component